MVLPGRAWHGTRTGGALLNLNVVIGRAIVFIIGFGSAALLAALFVPLLVKRAARRAVGRAIAATPYAPEEIRADKDELRTKLVVSTRRLEISVAAMKAKTRSTIDELGQKRGFIDQLKNETDEKADAIVRLRGEVEERTAAIVALEERNKTLDERLRTIGKQFEIRGHRLREKEEVLADKEAELVKLVAELGAYSAIADDQRQEIDAMRTQVEEIRSSVMNYENAIKEAAWSLDEANDPAPWTSSTEANGTFTRRGTHRTWRS